MTTPDVDRRTGIITARAPGRVNLIGEHTDYNAGFVLPTPIPQHTTVQLIPTVGRTVRAQSADVPGGDHEYRIGAESPQRTWIDYVQGVTVILARDGHTIGGFDANIRSEVPIGSGLSSSAALEIALLRALREAFTLPLTDVQLAQIGQRVENDFVGAPVGIMDQMASSVGRPGEALFLDTDTMAWELVPLPASAELVVIDSLVRHNHASGDYRTRRQECERACEALGVKRLRDVDPVALGALDALETLPELLLRRARHVVSENRRVLEMVDALRNQNLDECGRLLDAGHISLRDDFEISVPEVDRLVDIATMRDDVYGARMTGGGFGGAIVALAAAGSGARAAQEIVNRYQTDTGKPATVLVP